MKKESWNINHCIINRSTNRSEIWGKKFTSRGRGLQWRAYGLYSIAKYFSTHLINQSFFQFTDHSEQTIHLAQVLQKFIWTSGGTFSHLLQEASALQNAEKMAALAASGAANPAFGLGLSSSDLEDADSSAASTPALNPLAATAAVLMASQQKATKANKDLLEKSVINSAANCDFVSADFSDDDDDDDEEVSCCLSYIYSLIFSTLFKEITSYSVSEFKVTVLIFWLILTTYFKKQIIGSGQHDRYYILLKLVQP